MKGGVRARDDVGEGDEDRMKRYTKVDGKSKNIIIIIIIITNERIQNRL